MLRVAVPNKGALSEAASGILTEAGYRKRSDPKDLTVIDAVNDVEFYFLRPRDVAIYVSSGTLDLGITGRDLAADSLSEVIEEVPLGFGSSTFRYAAPGEQEWSVADLHGKRIATSYPNLVRKDLAARGLEAEIIRLDGAVEISIQLGVADAIADVVGSGRTLRLHGLTAFGDSLCDSEAVLVRNPARPEPTKAALQFIKRVQGVVFGQQYVMIDYDCPKSLLDAAVAMTPGLESPTVSPMLDPEWLAVRAMVPRKTHQSLMDDLSEIGVRAILASDIRSCRF